MKIESVRAEITNVNPRKEKSDDGEVLASDISMEFTVPRDIINPLFPAKGFMDQFFSEEQEATIIDVVYPINYNTKVEDLKLTIVMDDGMATLEFAPAKIAKGMKLTPTFGGYVVVDCKFQVYPLDSESGMLDAHVKNAVDIALEPLNFDIEDESK